MTDELDSVFPVIELENSNRFKGKEKKEKYYLEKFLDNFCQIYHFDYPRSSVSRLIPLFDNLKKEISLDNKFSFFEKSLLNNSTSSFLELSIIYLIIKIFRFLIIRKKY